MSVELLEKSMDEGIKALAETKARLESRLREFEDREAKALRPNLKMHGDGEGEIETKEYRKAFNSFVRKGNDRALAELESKAMSEGSNPDGGYAVPKEIDAQLEAFMLRESPIRSIAKVVQVGTSDYHKLVNLRGTAAGWVGETVARPATNTPQFVDVPIVAGEIYANPQISQRLLDDVFFNVDSWIVEEIGSKFTEQESLAFISGDGVNKPLGFLTAITSTLGDDTRAYGTVEYLPTGNASGMPTANPADVLLQLAYKLKPGYRKNATWVMAPGTLATISQFKDSGGRYIFTPQMAPNVPATLWGYPIVEAEHMPAIAAGTIPIVFGDFNRFYEIVDRFGVRMLRDSLTNKPYVGFYTNKRVGGAVVNTEAAKFLKVALS